MKHLDNSILTTLRGYFPLAAADLALYPEGLPGTYQGRTLGGEHLPDRFRAFRSHGGGFEKGD